MDSTINWISTTIDTPTGDLPVIKTQLDHKDRLGNLLVRLGFNRNTHLIPAGLYAVGQPDETSSVFVTANYKLTFDSLRKELSGLHVWILVLDTKGINVWCAAGKGTFGTMELIHRIHLVQLDQVVSHKKIILPQLGAPGVAAHDVTKHTGFQVVYGPVKASDIPEFIHANYKATAEMRKIQFSMLDRLTVVPVEITYAIKFIPIVFALLFVFNLLRPENITLVDALQLSFYNFIPYVVAVVLGTVAFAALLPYIPFRSFALKGFILGFAWSAIVFYFSNVFHFPDSMFIRLANVFFLTAITTFFGLNFTGSTTFTSLSGVEKETTYTIPAVIGAAAIGLGLSIVYLITSLVN